MTIERITSPQLEGISHGFFTRHGGASSGVFAGLNCGYGSSDQHDIVSINRARVAEVMETDVSHLVGVHQIHSADVIHVSAPLSEQIKADGLVTATPDIALTVLTADCQPVLFADRNAGVIGAAHAGWKGALGGVLETTVHKMEVLGAQRKDMHVVIGPAISQRNYEVGPEFRDQFVADDPGYAKFFTNGAGDRFHFDLPGFGLHRLNDCGVGQASWTRHCTYADPDRFFSYRRSVHHKEADYGRLIAAIRL